MRLPSRRRPAGVEWVPNEFHSAEVVAQPIGPIVLRLGPGLELLDPPNGFSCTSVANVWIADGHWVEAAWPRDQSYGWFVAPIDLRLGHVVEFRHPFGIIAGWVADANAQRLVFVVTADRTQAWEMAGIAYERWSNREVDRLR